MNTDKVLEGTSGFQKALVAYQELIQTVLGLLHTKKIKVETTILQQVDISCRLILVAASEEILQQVNTVCKRSILPVTGQYYL